MNCANHPDRERAAFCQNCGKPLCTECTRPVGTSVFCEPCLVARVGANPVGSAGPGYSYVNRNYTGVVPPVVPGVPNPGLAALLGLIPGVGAMYNEQYAKGIVHLIVFAVLVSLAHEVGIFHLFVFGWVIYMAIEAHHTARARRDGTPLPDPFGLNDISEHLGFGRGWSPFVPPGTTTQPGTTPPPVPPVPPGPTPNGAAQEPPPFTSVPPGGFPGSPRAQFVQEADGTQTYSAPGAYFRQAPDGSQTYSTGVPPASPWGAPQDAYPYTTPPVPPVPPMPPYPDPNVPYARRIPTGAIWLIGLGLIFLFGNSGMFFFHGRFFGPVLLIGVAVWLFFHKMTGHGLGLQDDGTPLYRWRLAKALSWSFWVLLVGILWLLDACDILSWEHSWPLFLIGGGLMHLLRRGFYGYGGYGSVPPSYPPYPTPPATPPVVSTGLVPTDPSKRDDSPDGR